MRLIIHSNTLREDLKVLGYRKLSIDDLSLIKRAMNELINDRYVSDLKSIAQEFLKNNYEDE